MYIYIFCYSKCITFVEANSIGSSWTVGNQELIYKLNICPGGKSKYLLLGLRRASTIMGAAKIRH